MSFSSSGRNFGSDRWETKVFSPSFVSGSNPGHGRRVPSGSISVSGFSSTFGFFIASRTDTDPMLCSTSSSAGRKLIVVVSVRNWASALLNDTSLPLSAALYTPHMAPVTRAVRVLADIAPWPVFTRFSLSRSDATISCG